MRADEFSRVHLGQAQPELLPLLLSALVADDPDNTGPGACAGFIARGMYVPVANLARLLGSPVLSIITAAALSSLDIGWAELSTSWQRR